jgi:hypothetical protein
VAGERRQRQPSVAEVADELRVSEEAVLDAMHTVATHRMAEFALN